MRLVRVLAGLSAGLSLAVAPSSAQLPAACAPAPVGEALAPLPFPNPYPVAPTVEQARVGVPAAASALARVPRGPDRPPARGADCAREARVSAWAGSGWADPRSVTTATYAGDRLTVLDEAEDAGTGLTPTWRTTFTYGGGGRLTRRQRERYVDGAFVLSSRTNFTYDGRGYLASATDQSHTGTGWRNEYRSLLSVDAGPYAYELVFEYWKDGAWVRSARLFYEHTPDNRLLVQSSFSADGPDWLPSYRERFTYDDADRLAEHAFDNGTGSDWELAFRTVFSYDDAGRLTAADAQEWFGEDWIPYAGTAYAYDAEGRLDEAVESAVLPGGGTLELVARDRFAYGPEGRVEVVAHDTPDSTGWQPESRDLYAWDGDRLRTRETQVAAGDAWTFTEQLLLLYGGTVDGESDPPTVAPRLSVGPSPAARSATVRLTLAAPAVVAVRVVDARGRVVARLPGGTLAAGDHAWPLDTSRLAAGVYAVEARVDGRSVVGRLVVVR